MLNVNFQDHRTSGITEDSLRFFTIYGRSSYLGHVTLITYINLPSPFLRRPCTSKLTLIGQAVSDEMFEHCGQTTTTTDAGAWVYYKLTVSLAAQVSSKF